MPIAPGEYLVTYRAIDKYGNTGVCQVQLLAEAGATRSRDSQPEKINSHPWQPTQKPAAKPSQQPNCKNISAPNNGQVFIFRNSSFHYKNTYRNIGCKTTRYGRLCRLTCDPKLAFADGSTRKIYFCDSNKGTWRPNRIEQDCPKPITDKR